MMLKPSQCLLHQSSSDSLPCQFGWWTPADRAVEALVGDEACPGITQDVKLHASPLGQRGGVQPGVDRAGLGEEHVAPRAEHDEEADVVVLAVVELEDVDSLVVPEHEPVVLAAEEGQVSALREILDQPELMAGGVAPRDAVLVNRSASTVHLDVPNLGKGTQPGLSLRAATASRTADAAPVVVRSVVGAVLFVLAILAVLLRPLRRGSLESV